MDVPDDTITVAVKFNEQINAHDLEMLAESMTDDHRFADSSGQEIVGRDQVKMAWQAFFSTWPDFQNIFSCVLVQQDRVVMMGQSYCSDSTLAGPALWTAKIRDGKVSFWKIWQDTPASRQQLGLPDLGATNS